MCDCDDDYICDDCADWMYQHGYAVDDDCR